MRNNYFSATGIALSVAFAASGVQAATVTIDFESAIADYVPAGQQALTDQFASLGILFADTENGGGASAGDCGPVNGSLGLYGAIGQGDSFAGCGDTTPGLMLSFVNPLDSSEAGYTTSFSIVNTDGLVELTAFDIDGNILGTDSNFSGTLSLSGIGNINWVTLVSLDQDPTTMDDIIFEEVTAIPSAVVPLPASLPLLAAGAGSLVALRRRNRG